MINGTADSTAPTLTSATVAGTALKLNFSEALQDTQVLTNSLFTVQYSTDGGTTWTTQSHTVNGDSSDFTNGGSTIAVDIDSAITDEVQVRVSYAASSVGSADEGASDAMVSLADFSNSAVINGTQDAFSSTLGCQYCWCITFTLVFSEGLDNSVVITDSTFTIRGSTDDGVSYSVLPYTVNGDTSDYSPNDSTVTLDFYAISLTDSYTNVDVSYALSTLRDDFCL